jgi:acyl dehydratase
MTMVLGETLTSSYRITRDDLRDYAVASGDHNPIHLDPQAAKAANLPDTIAHGMLVMGLALSAVGRAGVVRECKARWSRPVVVPAEGTEITVDATVTAVTDEGTRLRITAFCGGEQTMTMPRVVVSHDSPEEEPS